MPLSSTKSAVTHGGLTVFVPCFNHSRYVAQTLRSIFLQTLPPTRLLVIDDGSTDRSRQVIEETLKACPFDCDLISRANKGLTATLNEGFARSTGEYFAYIGSDDLWLPRFLEARVQLLNSRPDAVLAHGNAYTIDANSKIVDSSADWNSFVSDEARSLLDRSLGMISSTVCYRRSALEGHRWNENSRLEDLELYLYLSYEGTFAFDPAVLSTWRMHDSNASGDAEWMLSEALAAQRRVAAALDRPAEQLKLVEAKTRLEYALLFARRGAKARAIKLLLNNWHRSPDAEKLIKTIGHCILPSAFKKRRSARISNTVSERFRSENEAIANI